MKRKRTYRIAAAVMLLLAVSGCSLFGSQADGLILFGTREQTEKAVKAIQANLVDNQAYTVKTYKTNKEGAVGIIVDKSTAKKWAAAGLLQRIEHQKSAPLSSLPELPADGGILFAESPSPSQTVSNYSLPVRYEGNVVIGETRGCVHQIVILDDAAWDGLEAEERTIAVLKSKKDPKHELSKIIRDVQQAQLFTFPK